MSDGSIITQEMRDGIGRESEPWIWEVDRTAIRMFARAVGYDNPIFFSVEAAKADGHPDLPCPPGFLGVPTFVPGESDPTLGTPIPRRADPKPSTPLPRMLNGGTEFEYFGEVHAGDRLSVVSYVDDLKERSGSLGQMLFTTTKTVYRNGLGEVVAITTGTVIQY